MRQHRIKVHVLRAERLRVKLSGREVDHRAFLAPGTFTRWERRGCDHVDGARFVNALEVIQRERERQGLARLEPGHFLEPVEAARAGVRS